GANPADIRRTGLEYGLMKAKYVFVQTLRLSGDGALAVGAYIAGCAFVIGHPLTWWTRSDLGLSILSLSLIYGVAVMIVFGVARMYERPWQGVSAHDVGRIIRLTAVAALLFLAFTFLVTRAAHLPRSVLLVSWFLSAGGMAAARLLV